MLGLAVMKAVLQGSRDQLRCLGCAACTGNRLGQLKDRQSRHCHSRQNFHTACLQLCSDSRKDAPKVTVSDKVQQWTERFTKEDIAEPQASADLIVAHALGYKMIHEVNQANCIDGATAARIDKLCGQRLQSQPVQYIIGEWDFHDMTLDMQPPVLIPRTETEELAAYILEDQIHQQQECEGAGHGTKILDIGCGSGALALYLLKELPMASCVAVDMSETACQLTYRNACKYGLQDRLDILHGSIDAEAVMARLEQQGQFDVVVSNPPYIPTADMEKLETQVYSFEDNVALHGGCDGMDLIRYILSVTNRLLKPHVGALWLEVDLSHPVKVEALVNDHYKDTLQYVKTLQDYTNRDRFCVIKGHNSDSPG